MGHQKQDPVGWLNVTSVIMYIVRRNGVHMYGQTGYLKQKTEAQ